jgi:hypothetical protein
MATHSLSRHADLGRTGTCAVCGQPVADHYRASNRWRGCQPTPATVRAAKAAARREFAAAITRLTVSHHYQTEAVVDAVAQHVRAEVDRMLAATDPEALRFHVTIGDRQNGALAISCGFETPRRMVQYLSDLAALDDDAHCLLRLWVRQVGTGLTHVVYEDDDLQEESR